MMCPFCLQENVLKARVCASCGRDIAVPEKLLTERDDLVRKRDVLRSELKRQERDGIGSCGGAAPGGRNSGSPAIAIPT